MTSLFSGPTSLTATLRRPRLRGRNSLEAGDKQHSFPPLPMLPLQPRKGWGEGCLLKGRAFSQPGWKLTEPQVLRTCLFQMQHWGNKWRAQLVSTPHVWRQRTVLDSHLDESEDGKLAGTATSHRWDGCSGIRLCLRLGKAAATGLAQGPGWGCPQQAGAVGEGSPESWVCTGLSSPGLSPQNHTGSQRGIVSFGAKRTLLK